MASTRSAEEGAFFAIVADKHITAFPEGMGEIRFRMGDAPGIGASVTFPGGDGVQVLDIPLQHFHDEGHAGVQAVFGLLKVFRAGICRPPPG